jgi:predicted PurR-regulated permease PerM
MSNAIANKTAVKNLTNSSENYSWPEVFQILKLILFIYVTFLIAYVLLRKWLKGWQSTSSKYLDKYRFVYKEIFDEFNSEDKSLMKITINNTSANS